MRPGEIITLLGTGHLGKLYSRVILGRIAVATRIGDLTKIITQALCDAEDKSEEILTIRLSAQKGKYVGLNPVEFCTAVAATYLWERTNKNVVIRFLVQKPPEEQYLLQALAKSTYAYMNPENPEDKQRGYREDLESALQGRPGGCCKGSCVCTGLHYMKAHRGLKPLVKGGMWRGQQHDVRFPVSGPTTTSWDTYLVNVISVVEDTKSS